MPWWRRRPRCAAPPPRLTQAAVRAIAHAHVEARERGSMNHIRPETQGAARVWQVSAVGIGSGAWLTIDDATGEVIRSRRWGIR